MQAHIEPGRVGLIGHSRGGEAVVAAQQILVSRPRGFSVLGVASLSPTDGPNRSGASSGGRSYDPAVPYLMVCGTRDTDLSGYAGNPGVRTYDRASRPRHQVEIDGANHNFFNTTWGEESDPTITRAQQQELTKALVTPFFSDLLLGQQAYVELLSGVLQPESVTDVGTVVRYSDQPQRWTHFTVDDSQDVPAGAESNSLGEANTSASLSAFVEESLRYEIVPTRNDYTQDTDGLRAGWDAAGASLSFGVGRRDVSWFDFLSFRVGQRYRSSDDLNRGGAQDLSVSLVDSSGASSPPIRVSTYVALHPVDAVGINTRSAMQTVRVPLRAFTANGSALNLSRLATIRFDFDQSASGELIIDDVEFLGIDVTEQD